ncbi:hypothetical protein Tco_0964384, partial [Tanacetum coccineum]
MSNIDHTEAIDKSMKAHLKNVLPKYVTDFSKIKQEKAAKQSMPKYSTKPFDEASLKEYDLKEKLIKLMMKSKKKKDYDALSLKKIKDKEELSKGTKASSGPSPTQKAVDDDELIQDGAMDDTKMIQDDDMVAGDMPHDDAAPIQDLSKWFKQDVVVRPETPDPKWHKEPNADDVPEQPWFNEMVNAEKDPVTFDDLMSSTIDFTKYIKHCLKKDRTTKADLEGPTFKLLKGNYRNYIELEYNMERNPLPLQGPLGHTTIPIDFFFNKDLEYLKKGNTKRKYAYPLTKPKATRYELDGLEEMILNLWSSSNEGYDLNASL